MRAARCARACRVAAHARPQDDRRHTRPHVVLVLFRSAGCRIFRHSFATHMQEAVYDIHTVQDLPGHRDVSTTMLYTHVLNRGGLGVRSPLDLDTPGARPSPLRHSRRD